MARNLSTALRTGNYPPLHPVAASHTTFVDSQLLLLDMSMLEDRTLSHTCWLLHAMPSSSLLGVLLCLEPRDIHSFAVAAGVTDIQAPEMIDTDPVLRWQYATHLARQCITAPATMPRPRRRATQPLLCTAHSFAMPSDDEGDSVFLALFVRNAYTGLESSSSPRAAATTLHVTGHMEAMDIVVTLPSVQSIVDVADAISRQCSFRSSPQTATTPSKYQGVPDITFQVETLRVFLPTHTMLCIDHIHVDSGLPPLSMEGLSSPPFTPWTQKRRRPTIAPQPTADLTPHKLHTRLTNVYVATVQCRPDDQGTGPFEVCMARVGRRQALRIASVTYLVHPIFVSVEVAASSPHVSLHVTKVVVDLPRYAQSMALAGLAGAYVAAVRQSSIVRRQNRTRGPRASQYQQIVRPEEEHEEAEDILDSLCLFGWRVAVDGLELHVGTPPDTCQGTLRSSIVHVRVGCMSAAHSATSRQGSVSVKNVVVGFQSGDANEALIFGPFADPSEWQVAVERYPDTVLAASWSFESTHGWLWTGLVELQGVQCHVSVPFLHAIRPFIVGATPAPQTNSIQTSSAADGVREPLHTTVSVAGVRPIRQCKLKLLWAPSVVTMSSSHENDDKASIMVTCGPTFASLHVGYNPTQVEQLVTCQQPRSSLHQYMPLDVVETMGTIQGIRVAVLHTVRFPTTTKPFGSPTPSSSSWTVFEAQIQSPDPASVLLQDVQVRMSTSVKQVVESTQGLERRNSSRLNCGGYYMTDVQLETTPMDAAICFQTWMRLHALVSELVSSSLSDEMDETNPCTPYARPDPMHRLHLESLPTLDDFAELVHTSTDSSRVHPLPGELLVCRPTPSPPNQFDITTIMRLLNPQNQVSSVDDLFKHMNAPWTHDTMNAVDLHSNRLVGSLQWTYHLPRRVTRVVAMPLPLKSKQIVNTLEWPRLDLSDHVTRLCDVWCDLRWWSMADNAFVSVGTFYVPWEPQQHKASADDYDDEDGDGYPSSFASALLSWVEPSTPTDEDIALERCLQSTVTPREYIPHREQLSRTIGQSLMASLRISSVSGPQDWTGLSLSCVIPHVQMTLRRGQGELHDVARVKVADVVLHMQCASSSSSSSSFRGTGTVSGDLQNMVTLSSVPVLPPVQVAIGGSSSYRPAASPEDKRRHLLCPLGSTDRNLPQILFLTRLNVRASPVHLQLTPYAVKCLLEWPTLLGHTPKQDLTDMRIVLANGTGNVVYFRQLLTTEYRQVSAHTSVVYSWQSISAPLQLQFALSQPPHTWSTGCALNQPGVLYRECPRHGSFWVDIVADGIQTKVTLRGSIVLHNYTAQSLRCRWSVSSNSVANTIVNAAMPCTACSRNDALPPLATWWVWDLADEAKCTTLQGPASKHVSSKRRGSTSGLAWIRHRLGSFDSSSVPQLGPSCSVRLSVANAANEFGWSRPIPMHATATMPSRHRLILPHRQHRHLMATVHKTTKDGLTTCVSISHDPQPPVAFHNHVNHVFGVTTRSIPGGVVMVPAQGIVEYDWDIQQTQYGDDDKGEDEEVEGGGGEDHISTRRPPPPITTTPSVFDATGKDLPPSRLRFRLCLPADNNNETADAAVGWSNELWVVEGIQFAKWTDKAVAVVLLVTAYMRAGTWIVRLECVEGPYTNHTPRHSTLLLQCRDQPSRNRHRTDQLHRTRVDITVDEIALSLFDEQAVVQSMYQELFRLSAKQCHVTWASASDAVPEAAKLRHDLGYLDHLHSFSTSVVHLGSLELIHLFDDCNFPVILATCPPSSSSALRMLTDADLLAKHISPSSESLLLRVIPPSSPTVPDTAAGGYDDGTPESWHQPVCPKVFIEHLSIQPIEMTITARSIYGLDRTPLTLSAVTLTNVFCDPDQLIKDIAANYVADALVHSPMVLMSLNVFGNPAGFVRDVSTGVQDLVRMPLLAVAEHGYTPYSMTRGIVRGTASFLTHASVAALTSVSGIAMAISNSMNHLALAHQPRSQIMPNTFASGLSGGLVSLGSAVVGGATGVVTTPLTLLRDNQARGQDTGLRGGLVGVTKGLVGIVAQPMSGVASLVSMTSQGLLVEMGFGPVQPIPLQVALTRNEALHVRWKILSEWNVAGDIQYAPALYWDDMNTVPEQPTKAVLLNPLELSWLLPRDPGRLGLCKVLLVVTPTHVFVVDEVEETIRRHIPLSHVTAMEQNVMEPTKFELGIGQPALKVQWYRFRLAAMDRRRLGRVVAALKKW
ncbi:hypothetical protein DYB25_003544 [Aphanomyces astaci]|uniref:Uncharacterized protein n=1 Tax=Aphanomyces astaci TaxID=112090 RepID=A0A396ZVM9_APHAT|nr:hypothetical protein DYB25_003544 [Aphanomyces astaci]